MAFASIDATAWPAVVVRFFRADPTAAEQRSYFEALAAVLNDRASPASPCFLVFDASAMPVAALLNLSMEFFNTHTAFNKAYYDRMNAVCSGFGIVVAQPLVRGLIKAALASAPPRHPCNDYKTVEAAVAAASGKGCAK